MDELNCYRRSQRSQRVYIIQMSKYCVRRTWVATVSRRRHRRRPPSLLAYTAAGIKSTLQFRTAVHKSEVNRNLNKFGQTTAFCSPVCQLQSELAEFGRKKCSMKIEDWEDGRGPTIHRLRHRASFSTLSHFTTESKGKMKEFHSPIFPFRKITTDKVYTSLARAHIEQSDFPACTRRMCATFMRENYANKWPCCAYAVRMMSDNQFWQLKRLPFRVRSVADDAARNLSNIWSSEQTTFNFDIFIWLEKFCSLTCQLDVGIRRTRNPIKIMHANICHPFRFFSFITYSLMLDTVGNF